MRHVCELYREYREIITGYILPKFDLSNMDGYISLIKEINKGSTKKTYIMPILESRMVADIGTRVGTLSKIKEAIDTVKEYVLNVRVGGNDFCNLYGLTEDEQEFIDYGFMNYWYSDYSTETKSDDYAKCFDNSNFTISA